MLLPNGIRQQFHRFFRVSHFGIVQIAQRIGVLQIGIFIPFHLAEHIFVLFFLFSADLILLIGIPFQMIGRKKPQFLFGTAMPDHRRRDLQIVLPISQILPVFLPQGTHDSKMPAVDPGFHLVLMTVDLEGDLRLCLIDHNPDRHRLEIRQETIGCKKNTWRESFHSIMMDGKNFGSGRIAVRHF